MPSFFKNLRTNYKFGNKTKKTVLYLARMNLDCFNEWLITANETMKIVEIRDCLRPITTCKFY